MSSTRKRAETVPAVSELEERAIWDEYDTIYLPPSTNTNGDIHLEKDCQRLAKTDRIREKDLSVFPRGYKDVCKTCLYQWRNDG